MAAEGQVFGVERIHTTELDWAEIREELLEYVRAGVSEKDCIRHAHHLYLRQNGSKARDWENIVLPRIKREFRQARNEAIQDEVISGNTTDLRPTSARELADQYSHSLYLIKGLIPAEGIGMIYGPSGSSKGFFVLDIAAAIAAGEGWQGRQTKKSDVVIVNLEGSASFPLRLRAWREAHRIELPSRLFVINDAPINITDPTQVERLAKGIVSSNINVGLIVIDTLARASPGIDENSSEGMGGVIAGSEQLQRLTGGMVALVHHVGKDATKGPRGHSSMLAALDFAIEIERVGTQKTWRLTKAKDGEDGIGGNYTLSRIPLGEDADGDQISSCVVSHTAPTAGWLEISRLPKGKNQRLALTCVEALLNESLTLGKGGSSSTTPCVQLEHAVAECGKHFSVQPKRRLERARAAIDGLIAAGLLENKAGWVWRPQDNRSYAPPLTRPVSPAPVGAAGKNGMSGEPKHPKTDESGKNGNAVALQ